MANFIVRNCPICGEFITIEAGKNIPVDIIYIRSKRGSVQLYHSKCIGGHENGHKQS